jgi:hypothetical protein
MKRVVAAFLAAPLGAAALVALITLVLTSLDGFYAEAVGFAGSFFALAAILGYGVAVVLGIPGYLIFRRFGWIRRAHWFLLCAALGGVAGAAWPLGAVLAGIAPDNPLPLIGGFVGAGLLLGAAAGLVFAFIIRIAPPRPEDIAATFD